MPINLMNLPAHEAEALAYAEGFPNTARLFARIDAIQCAAQNLLGVLEVLGGDLDPGIIKAMDALHDEVNQ